MSYENAGGPNEGAEKNLNLESLKSVGVSLAGRYNALEKRRFDEGVDLKPNTWNENAGVLAVVDEKGELFVVPSTERYRDQLSNYARLTKDEKMGVPHVGVAEVWSGKDTAEDIPGFQEWREAFAAAEEIRQIEREEEAAGGDEAKYRVG